MSQTTILHGLSVRVGEDGRVMYWEEGDRIVDRETAERCGAWSPDLDAAHVAKGWIRVITANRELVYRNPNVHWPAPEVPNSFATRPPIWLGALRYFALAAMVVFFLATAWEIFK